MVLKTEDGKKYVDIGTSDLWFCLYSTVVLKLPKLKKKAADAIQFMKTGTCNSDQCWETARQINLIRDGLSACPLSDLVYNMNDAKQKVPWEGRISSVITSCGNFFTTADGKDLLFELTALLCYAAVKKCNVICDD